METITNFDVDKILACTERTYREWLEAIAATNDRDQWFEYANDIRNTGALRDSDRTALYKLIAKRMGCTVKILLQEIVREFDGAKGAEGAEKDDRTLARAALDENLKFSPQGFFLWRDSGVWQAAHDREIRQRIGDVLQGHGLPVANRKISDVFNVLKDCAYDGAVRFDQPQHNRVNCLSGTLELNDGKWTLREHRREDYLTQQLPVAYDPSATCPRFDRFLQEIFEGDKDASDKGVLIREMLGYCLVPSARYERFFILPGEGSNGKSTLFKVLQGLIAPGQIAAVEPHKLTDRFQRAHLRGKLVNLVAELPVGSKVADDALKSFTSGDLVTAEYKGQNPFDFNPFATILVSTNNMPHSRDLSRGMFRRAVIIGFNQSFEGREDKYLSEQLKEELPGIFASVLQAYADVVARGGFTMPDSCKVASEDWRRDCDTVATWAHECCTVGTTPGSTPIFTEFSRAFDDYRSWCDVMGVKSSVSGKAFGDRLEVLGAVRGKSVGKVRIRGFHHLSLSPPPEV